MTDKPFLEKEIQSIISKMQALYKKKEITNLNFDGLSTGLNDLDKVTGGLTKGDLILIGGDSCSGKTSHSSTFNN